MPLHTRIMIGLVVGALLGLVGNMLAQRGDTPSGDTPPATEEVSLTFAERAFADANDNGLADWLDTTVYWVEPIGQIFLRLMFMVVLPLVVSALSLAIVGIGDLSKLGRMGLRTLAFTALLSGTAVLIGITLVNVVRPGDSLSPELRDRIIAEEAEQAQGKIAQAEQAKSLRDTLVDLLPENPLQEMVGALDGSSKGNGMLAVMVFSLLLGAAITVNPEACAGLIAWLEGLNTIAMTIIGWAMQLAPFGAGALVFAVTAQLGFAILGTLAWFVGTCLAGLAIHMIGTYSVVLLLFGRTTPFKFFRNAREAVLVAFGTSSSNATLPTAIKVATVNLNIPPRVANFVLTVGATGNQNGTALFEGFVVLFLAQVMGIDLSLAQQFTVVLMSVFAGIGTAGVPGGSIPLIIVVMQSVGIPAEAIGIIIGIDRLLDMCRTVVNVAGDLVVAECVAAGEPEKG